MVTLKYINHQNQTLSFSEKNRRKRTSLCNQKFLFRIGINKMKVGASSMQGHRVFRSRLENNYKNTLLQIKINLKPQSLTIKCSRTESH